MANTPKKQSSYDMSAEEVAAVKEGMADFAKGRVVTEAQFEAEMDRFMERRRTEIKALRVGR